MLRRLLTACAALCAAAATLAAPTASAADNPVALHGMVYMDAPHSFKEAMFRAAAEMGASELRVDISLSGIFLPDGERNWSNVDEIAELSRRYGVPVLADVGATPWFIAACPPGVSSAESFRCATNAPGTYGAMVGALAAHTRGTIRDFEIVNEPDGVWTFRGTPQQYARMLAAAYDHVHAANPQARVLLGGIMNLAPYGGAAFLSKVFATPGADAIHKFDVANVHIRGSALQAGRHLKIWRYYLHGAGFDGPIWVTEHGYPSDPAYQADRAFQGGEQAQADFLATSMPLFTQAGAGKVFVTLRDALHDRYASEGVLRADLTRKPAFYTLQALAARYRGQGQPVTSAEAAIGAEPAMAASIYPRVKLRAGRRRLRGRVGGSGWCEIGRVRIERRGKRRWRGVRSARVRHRRFSLHARPGRYRASTVAAGTCARTRSKPVRVR